MVMAVAQGVSRTEICLSGKQRVLRGDQEACHGCQDLLALQSSPAPGLAGEFRIKKNQNIQQYEKNNPPQTQ